MKIVVGLGNPGDKYRATRHNVGFRAVDLLAERHGGAFEARGDLGEKAWTARIDLRGHPVVLAKPRTFMNRSGSAVLAVLRKHPVEPKTDLIVVFVLTRGGPGEATRLLSIYGYDTAFKFQQTGFAAAMFVTMGLIMLALALAAVRLLRRAGPT